MRLNNYLLVEEFSAKVLDKKEFKYEVKKYCSDTVKNNVKIYRGEHSDDGYLYVKPPKGRVSPYASNNIYNLLLSNLPSWSKYPKRHDSIICSTDQEKAKTYNQGMYRVYPVNGAKIGVCPVDDIWFSFEKVLDTMTLNGLNKQIEELFDYINFDYNMDNITYQKVKLGFDITDEYFSDAEKFNILYKKDKVLYEFLRKFHYTLGAGIPLLDCINKYMSPEYNNFSLVTAGKKIYGSCEVWTDSPCYMEYVDY